MAIKERLLKQLNKVRDGLHTMPPFISRDLQAIRNALLQARDLCFQGLSENRFAEYKDTYDGLLLALEQLAADALDKDEIVSLCSELLQYMITQTQNETAFKKEIFFLPYKASMWDSLESVWKAADEDKEHCIAYVMPIPYADLTPEHTAAEWHCERELFPKDVPTVKWEDFDLQEIHPDVIFIHNPYDEYNRVTSVESRYYSSVLKNQTDKLVYIPYFVTGNPTDEQMKNSNVRLMIANGMEHFITTPGVLNSNVTIVQSEEIRDIYIDVLAKYTNIKERSYWEKRILGLGSPKYDKILTTKKMDIEIPFEWKKIIERPDGSWKKVVLYNTGLSAFLKNDEKMLVQIRQVLTAFKEYKDEVALLWRPHPLLLSTLKSMRPNLLLEYETIIYDYRSEGWGIYDDTSDINRAIVLSSAYYGDSSSSVTELYRKTGKPLWRQVVDDSRPFTFTRNIEVCQDDGYFVDSKTGSVCQIKFSTGGIREIDYIPARYISTENPYSLLCKIGEKIIILPEQEKRILEYDIEKRTFREAALITGGYSSSAFCTFTKYIKYKNSVFFIGFHQGSIIKYDIKNGTYHPLERQWEMIKLALSPIEYKNATKNGWLGYAYQDENQILIPIAYSNKLLCLNMDDDSMEIHTLDGLQSIQDMSWDMKYFYFLQLDGKIVRYVHTDNNEWVQNRVYTSHIKGKCYLPYFFLKIMDEKVFLYPGTCGEISEINTIDSSVSSRKVEKQMWACTQALPDGKYLDVSVGSDVGLMHIMHNGHEVLIKLFVPSNVRRDIDRLLHENNKQNMHANDDELVGKNIYKVLRRDIGKALI